MKIALHLIMFLFLGSCRTSGTASLSETEANLNRLRTTGSCVGCTLENVDFSAMKDTSFLKGARLTKAKIRGSNFSALDLSGVRFELAEISDSKFIGAILARADFRSARLNGNQFASADLKNSLFSGTFIDSSDFASAELEGASLQEVVIKNSNLSFANLQRIRMERSLISKTDMVGTNLRHATLLNSDIASTRVDGTIVSHSLFSSVRFPQTNSGAFLTDDMLDFYSALRSTRTPSEMGRTELMEIGKVMMEFNKRLGIDIPNPNQFLESYTKLKTPSDLNSSILVPLYKQSSMLSQLAGSGSTPVLQAFAETMKAMNPNAGARFEKQFGLSSLANQGLPLSQRVLPAFARSEKTFGRLRADPGERISSLNDKKNQYMAGFKGTAQLSGFGKKVGGGLGAAYNEKTKVWTTGKVLDTSKSKEKDFGGKTIASADIVFGFDTQVQDVEDFEKKTTTILFLGGDKVQVGVGLNTSKGEFSGVQMQLGVAASTGPKFGMGQVKTNTEVFPFKKEEEPKKEEAPKLPDPKPEAPAPNPQSGGTTPSENAAQNVGMPSYGDDPIDSEALAFFLPTLMGSLGCDAAQNKGCDSIPTMAVRDSTGYALPLKCQFSNICVNPPAMATQESLLVFKEWQSLTVIQPDPSKDPITKDAFAKLQKVPQVCLSSDVCTRDPQLELPPLGSKGSGGNPFGLGKGGVSQ